MLCCGQQACKFGLLDMQSTVVDVSHSHSHSSYRSTSDVLWCVVQHSFASHCFYHFQTEGSSSPWGRSGPSVANYSGIFQLTKQQTCHEEWQILTHDTWVQTTNEHSFIAECETFWKSTHLPHWWTCEVCCTAMGLFRETTVLSYNQCNTELN